MSAYIEWLRRHIGRAKTPLVFASTIVTDHRGAILCQRRADFGDAWWGLPGGVMELGESITQTAIRETREETGLTIQPTRLVGLYTSPDFDVTYPNGDQVQQVTACFACETIGGALRPQVDEIVEMHYFPLGSLPSLPPWYAAMLADFLADRPEASFRAGSPGSLNSSANETIRSLRQAVGGPDPILIAAANAFIRIDDKVLLQQRGDSGTWNMPGGAIELGERIDQTAVREAREETGLEVEPIRLVGVYSDPHWHVHYPHGDAVQVFAVHFECRVIGGALKTDGVETIDVRWFPLDDLPVNLPERHRVRIADALAGWEGAFVR